MTTSKTLHNHLVALSQKGRRKKEPSKHKQIDTARFVELTKVVLHSSRGSAHHVTTRRVPVAPDAKQDVTTSSSARDTYYPKIQQQLTQEIEQMEEKKQQTRQKQVAFWGLYKYALEKVSKLNDLRDAPDAILPGNFPDEGEKQKAVTVVDESQEARV